MKLPPHHRGIFFALAGFTSWVLSDVSLKFIGQSMLPKYEIVALMSLFAIVTMMAITLLRKKARNLRPRSPKGLIILGLLLGLNLFLFLVAFKFLPLANIYAIAFATPMLTVLSAAIFLKERVTWQQVAAIIVGFAGVIIAIDFSLVNAVKGSALGYAAAFLSLFVYTASMLTLRIYAQSETPECLAFYPRLLVAGAGLLLCALGPCVPISASQIIPLFAAGFFAVAGWQLLAIASQEVSASGVAPFRYSQIITGALCGYLIWNDIPSWNLILGIVIIIAAGLYTIKHGSNSHRARKAEVIP